jgi:alkylhydroperoxidase family enzyme
MPRIAVPEGQDPMTYLWSSHAPGLARPAGAFSGAVYAKSTLPIREFEAARVRTAQINNCQVCLNFRSATDVADRAPEADDIDEDYYAHIGEYDWDGFTERELLAAQFAEKYALDHRNIDDAFWVRLHAAFTDDELVELALCIASWIAFGRLNVIFDVDGACRVPQYA